MPSLTDRLRDLFASDRDRASAASGDGPQPAAEVPAPTPAKELREVAREPEPVDPAEALTIAQGQELLGPCRECDGYWTREVVRGQKPLDCPVCKRDGPPGS